MAGKGIQINFLSNVRDLLRGTDDAEKAFEDVADSLDDVARDGERSTERLERSFKDLSNTVKRDLPDSYRDAERASRRFERNASDDAGEFKQEFKQNLSEVTSSFDGSMSSIQDLAQGTFGGLASALTGPLGVAVTGVAIGIGGIVAALQNAQEQTEKNKQAAADWADKFVESADRVISASTVAAGVLAIQNDPEQYEKATQNAKNWGVEVSTALRAMAGDATALDLVQGNVDELAAAMKAYGEKRTQPTEEEIQAYLDISAAYGAGSTALNQLNSDMQAGRDIAFNTSEALKGIARDAGDATKEVDALGNILYTLKDGTTIYVDADTGLATQAVDKFKGDVDGIPETVNTRLEVDLYGAERKLQEFVQRDRTIRVTIDGKSYGRY